MSDTFSFSGTFPLHRPRRLRRTKGIRSLVRETSTPLDRLIMPYFVRSGKGVREAIDSMSGQYRFSIDALLKELEELQRLGVHHILLFGIPVKKDEKGSEAWSSKGMVQSAIRQIKRHFSKAVTVISDVCLCAYTTHGHCGVLGAKGDIENDPSLKLLAQTALSHAEAGADVIAPSDMMDGRIQAIRKQLDRADFTGIPILSYAAKYASAFYGPFRDAVHSHPASATKKNPAPRDRKTYQMDPANRLEALREIALDIEEGADMVMVKPALAYLDVIREASARFPVPVLAYAVSGEYAMVKAAAKQGLVDEEAMASEMITSIFRAGAQAVITYHAKDLARWIG